MAKRKLKRQLNLIQVVMLGTAGTIAAEIFVLTGHAAGIAGPEAVLALVLGGFLTLSIALNYSELATTYPVTGGAMTYVEEGFGNGLLMFLAGSLDCLSSTFYAALSAVGFAISLSVFIPNLPIVPVAVIMIAIVGMMHLRGVKNAGNFQIILGGFLLIVFAIFIIRGLTDAHGFNREIFLSGNVVFENQTIWQDLGRMLTTIALTYNAYVGFEVIADDAEEVSNPNRNIPRGILLSLLIATVVYSLVALVTIGTIPYNQLAGSTTALTDAAAKFWPNGGVQLMALAGIVATVTSINSAMLSATREAYTLSREKVWPRFLSRLSRWRTPYTAIFVVVIMSALVAAIGVVDLLSFISSTGYLFVLFWASLAMVRLHKKYPHIERPFKAPFFPLTAYLAAGSAVLIAAFADPKALLFLAAVIAVLTGVYYLSQTAKARAEVAEKLEQQEGGGRVLVASIHRDTAVSLVQLAVRLVDQQEDTAICVFTVLKTPLNLFPDQVQSFLEQHKALKKELLDATAPIAQEHDVALYVKQKSARRVEEAVIGELERHKEIIMVMLGFPKDQQKIKTPHNILKEIMLNAERDVVVLRDRGLHYELKNILVPVGNGPNARLALRMAKNLAVVEESKIVALRLVRGPVDQETLEDQQAQLQDIVESELDELPENLELRVEEVDSIFDGILKETERLPYDLMIIGAAEEVLQPQQLFGELNDALLEEAECSMLIVRHYQPERTIWLHKQIKRLEE